MEAILVLHGRDALPLHRARDENRRRSRRRDGLTQRIVDRVEVVAVERDRVPAECLRAGDVRVEIPPDHRLATLTEPVDVDDRREVVEPEVRRVLERLPHRALGHLAVAAEHPYAARQMLEVLRGERHPDADRKSLTERAGRDVDPRDARCRMAFEHARVLAVVEDVLVGDDACRAVDRVEERRCVAFREDETVVRGALRLGEVEAQVAVDEDGHQVGCGHRGRRVPRLRRRAHPHGVDAELLSELAPSLDRGHVAILRRVARGANVDAWRAADCTSCREHGVSVWVDSLSREMLETGELKRLDPRGRGSRRHVEPDDLREGAVDRRLVRRAAPRPSSSAPTTRRRSSSRSPIEDIKRACDLLRPVWERTDGVDGFVSLEVDPDLAYERDATFEQAKLLTERVDRPNLFVKIPATAPGVGAIEDSIAAGRSINVTLIFSLERHAAVAEAYVTGLERLVAGGGDPTHVASVASFFVSRVDTEADRRLAEVGREDLQGRLAIDNAKLAYQHYLEVFSGPRWEALAAAGARPQRCLWASTSTKNPAYRDVLYVEQLIGPNTVNTMPFETIAAFQDHGECRETLTEGVDGARELLGELAAAGVDYDDVTDTLEREGVQKFSESFASLLEGIDAKRTALV